jgi:hypothetical protein
MVETSGRDWLGFLGLGGVRPGGGALARAAHGCPWLLSDPGAQ